MTEAQRTFELEEVSAARAALGEIRRRPGTFIAATIASWIVLLLAIVVVATSAGIDRFVARAAQTAGVVVVLRDAASSDQAEALRRALTAVSGSGLVTASEAGNRAGTELGL